MKKNITRFVTIQDGEKEIEEKKYTGAPYTEFERKENNVLNFRIFYSTAANIPLYYATFISLILTIPLILIGIIFLTANFLLGMIIGLVIFDCLLFIPAFLIRQYKKSQSFEFIFNKISNKFTKSNIRSKSERKVVFESDLSKIIQLEIRSIWIISNHSLFGTTKHTIYLRFNDHSKIKLFYISYPNTFQILDYALWICDFLNIKYVLTTPHAKKVFASKRPMWN